MNDVLRHDTVREEDVPFDVPRLERLLRSLPAELFRVVLDSADREERYEQDAEGYERAGYGDAYEAEQADEDDDTEYTAGDCGHDGFGSGFGVLGDGDGVLLFDLLHR